MNIKRRDFIRASAVTLGATALASGVSGCATPTTETNANGPLDDLKSMTKNIVPISVEERKSRIEKAQNLMAVNKIDAMYLDGGTGMEYFTGVDWGTGLLTVSADAAVIAADWFSSGRAKTPWVLASTIPATSNRAAALTKTWPSNPGGLCRGDVISLVRSKVGRPVAPAGPFGPSGGSGPASGPPGIRRWPLRPYGRDVVRRLT